MAKRPAQDADLPLWVISQIKATPARELGRIQAATAEEAIKQWAEKFGITNEEQKSRLAARRVK